VSVLAEAPEAIAAATAAQPAARLALAAAASAPSHAYLLAGPPGSGKRAAARALAAELLAEGAPDPQEARRRALADPSPHPDLAWIRPPGTQHLVEEVRERVIALAAFRPFEGERRVFVIEAADAMAEESQNALLKTLEEPAPFAHLILISAEPEALLETVRSRCRAVRFARLAPEAVEARVRDLLAGRGQEVAPPAELRAVARLADGDPERAVFLLLAEGRALREAAEACVLAAAAGAPTGTARRAIVEASDAAGERAAAELRALAESAAEREAGDEREARRRSREAEEGAKRSGRRARTESLDLALGLIAALLRDLAAIGEHAPELALNADRVERLVEAGEIDPRRARRAAELVMDTRRRLRVNVGEELALEALLFRLEYLLAA